jgi:SAM-dependent methyltransferase
VDEVFVRRGGCPFCRVSGHEVLARIRYHETAEANRDLPDVEGELILCDDCGVAYPSHVYSLEAFPRLYDDALRRLRRFDTSPLQTIRLRLLKEVLRRHHERRSLSRLLDLLTLRVLQVPLVRRLPRGLRILDVGCGFGEFLSVYRSLGNDVTGTEIVPELVDRLRARGYDCRLGELEAARLEGSAFDLILLRAVFYRLRDPAGSLRLLRHLLAPGGEVALVDPCPGAAGAPYFFGRQFPQGQFYILDRARYLRMIHSRFGLVCTEWRLIYGRPETPVKRPARFAAARELLELFDANLRGRKPYFLSYNLREAP